jgi:hypothetical protein
MITDREKAAAAAAKGLAVRCAYTEFLRRENRRASDDAAVQFAKKVAPEKIDPGAAEWSVWQIVLLVTGRATPPG